MITVSDRIKLFDLSKVLLALLIVSINIREPYFHSREILFGLVVLTSYKFIDIRRIKYAIALVVIWAITAIYNILVPGSDFKLAGSGFNTIVIAGYLCLMCFCVKKYASTIISSYLIVSIIVAVITIVIWVICYFSSSAYSFLREYFIQMQESTGLSFIAIDLRAILGTRFLTVWYRTSPCMICALGYCLIERLDKINKHTILIVLFSVALFFSGTRANMMSAVLLDLLYVAFWFSRKRIPLFTLFIIFSGLFSAAMFAFLFFTDSGSASSAIKTSDTKSYFSTFASDGLRTLFFGWGPGSTFYSLGRGKMVDITELSLFETIRRYGLISTFVIFFYIWFSPIRSELFRRNSINNLFYVATLMAYIVTACTNPYLLDSVGFCALLFYCTCFKFGRLIHEDEKIEARKAEQDYAF